MPPMGWRVRSIIKNMSSVANIVHRKPELITDLSGRILVALVGRPTCSDPQEWDGVANGAKHALISFRDEGLRQGLFEQDASDRRGNFLAIATGISFGGGQRVRRGRLL